MSWSRESDAQLTELPRRPCCYFYGVDCFCAESKPFSGRMSQECLLVAFLPEVFTAPVVCFLSPAEYISRPASCYREWGPGAQGASPGVPMAGCVFHFEMSGVTLRRREPLPPQRPFIRWASGPWLVILPRVCRHLESTVTSSV